MPRTTRHAKETSFNFRLDPTLKAAFSAAAEAADKPAAQLLRDFMRSYVQQRERRAFEAEARRQSRAIAARAEDPRSDDYAVMQEMAAELQRDDFADKWKA
jgi:hypothetical protein